ncbi:hypothetical protein ACO0RG_003164 [Hanseniaspora osmophila]|uniref:Nitrogen permease regulator 2 n=1 Tax=Hanseniaspora osmophila TaxID=56408 RepID=A0A1E5REV8_9ASCO|nr:Nitrogen permease regulator 2 [Hanseniaspora osmophila]
MNNFSDITPIHTVFYSVFHPTEGTKVLFEFPPNNLVKSGIDFDTIKNYVIPKPQLCNKLVTFKYGAFRIVGYPVNVRASYYARNSYNFNVVFVFPYDSATTPYEPSIERLGKMLAVLEEQSQLLSKAQRDAVFYQLKKNVSAAADPGPSADLISQKYMELVAEISGTKRQLSIPDFLTKMFQDLNNYSECLIPIDAGNSIDIKLFSMNPAPTTNISIEDVPVTTVNLLKFVTPDWDPTMLKIVPYINGVNSIARIAKCSDSDTILVIECIKHLIYYQCATVVDIFQFQNVYAPTNHLSDFLTNKLLAAECQKYIISTDSHMMNLEFSKHHISAQKRPGPVHQNSASSYASSKNRVPSFSSGNSNHVSVNASKKSLSASSFGSWNKTEGQDGATTLTLPTKSCIFQLYLSLSQGQVLTEWYKQNADLIRANCIDVRKFVVFGITRGLIYRCHSHPILKNSASILDTTVSNLKNKLDGMKRKKKTLNLFSTADIKPDIENMHDKQNNPMNNFLKPTTSGSLSNCKSKLTSASDLNPDKIADDLLKEVYQKLTFKNHELHGQNSITNPKSILYSTQSNSSNGRGLNRIKGRTSGSTSRSKVVFDTISNSEEALIDNASVYTGENSRLQHQQEDKLQQEIMALVNCLKNADSIDRICTKLEKNRDEVEAMLANIGSYNIVNT